MNQLLNKRRERFKNHLVWIKELKYLKKYFFSQCIPSLSYSDLNPKLAKTFFFFFKNL